LLDIIVELAPSSLLSYLSRFDTRYDRMNFEFGKRRSESFLLPFALFGFLAPVATYLVAVSNYTSEQKTAILLLLALLYIVLFVISYWHLRGDRDRERSSTLSHAGANAFGQESNFRDPLTGLANERGLQLILERELAETVRYGDDRPLSVAAFCIQNLETIKHQKGSAISERVLKHAAEKIKKGLRAMDFAARTKNDDFLVVLPATDASGAEQIARRINHSLLEHPFEAADGVRLCSELFFGIATYGREGNSVESLTRSALRRKEEAARQANVK
jgi:diguanylate cyclase (GGDEF)-like protein